MSNFLLGLIGVLSLQVLMVFIGLKFHLLALIGVIISAIMIPIFAETGDWTWFTWVKTYSISVPIIFYAYLNFEKSKGKTLVWLEKVFPWILLLNMLEAGAVGLQTAFKSGSFQLIINGFTLVILAILAPRHKDWQFSDHKSYGFADATWIYANTAALSYFYFFSPEYGTLTISALLAILGPQIIAIVMKDTKIWFAARAYMLIVIVTIKACFDFINKEYLAPDFLNKQTVLAPMINDPFGYLFLFINVVTLVYFIKVRFFSEKEN